MTAGLDTIFAELPFALLPPSPRWAKGTSGGLGGGPGNTVTPKLIEVETPRESVIEIVTTVPPAVVGVAVTVTVRFELLPPSTILLTGITVGWDDVAVNTNFGTGV